MLKQQIVVFTIGDRTYALRLPRVERIVRAVDITAIPGASKNILGCINVSGQLVPVVNIRKRLGITEKDVEPSDLMLITKKADQAVAVVVDAIVGVVETSQQEFIEDAELASVSYVETAVKVAEETILILDPDQFVSMDKEIELDNARD